MAVAPLGMETERRVPFVLYLNFLVSQIRLHYSVYMYCTTNLNLFKREIGCACVLYYSKLIDWRETTDHMDASSCRL